MGKAMGNGGFPWEPNYVDCSSIGATDEADGQCSYIGDAKVENYAGVLNPEYYDDCDAQEYQSGGACQSCTGGADNYASGASTKCNRGDYVMFDTFDRIAIGEGGRTDLCQSGFFVQEQDNIDASDTSRTSGQTGQDGRIDSHVCVAVTVCTGTQYEVSPPNAIDDRVCADIDDCAANEYETVGPTATSNRECELQTVCTSDEYEVSAPEDTDADGDLDKDRECTGIVDCTSDEYETAVPTTTSNRECTDIDDCAANEYETVGPTAISNRECELQTVCTSDEYEVSAPEDTDADGDLDKDRECTGIVDCTSDEYETAVPTTTSNRECTDIDDCAANEYETVGPTAISNRECELQTVCTSDEYEVSAPEDTDADGDLDKDRECTGIVDCTSDEYETAVPTTTSNRECTDIDDCAANEYETVGPTAISNRECELQTVCTSDEYEVSAPEDTDGDHDLDKDRECELQTVCTSDEYETAVPTTTSNRECTDIDDCAANEYETVGPTTTSNRECELQTVCTSDEYEVSEPLDTDGDSDLDKDRVCTDLETCDYPSTQYEVSAPEDTDADGTFEVNRVCGDITLSCPTGEFIFPSGQASDNSECQTCPILDANIQQNTGCEDICGNPFDIRCELTSGSSLNTVNDNNNVFDNAGDFVFDLFKCVLGYYVDGQSCTLCPAVAGEGDKFRICTNADDSAIAVCAPDFNDPSHPVFKYVVPDSDQDNGYRCEAISECTGEQYIIKSPIHDGRIANTYNRECALVTQCAANEYETVAPVIASSPEYNTEDTNRECTDIDDCAANEYETVGPTTTSNRECELQTVCTSDEYEVSEPEDTDADGDLDKDRECTGIVDCTSDEYETVGPTTTSNRECTDIDDCAANEYETVGPTTTSNRECELQTVCTSDEYEVSEPEDTDADGDLDKDRECTGIVDCAANEYELAAPTANSQRVCKRCDATGDQYGVPQHSKALVLTCTKDGSSDDAVVSTCKNGFKPSGNKCVFNIDATVHTSARADGCTFYAVDKLFAFEYTYNSDVTPAFALNDIDIAVWRNTVLFLGRTTVDFTLTYYEEVKDHVTYYADDSTALTTGSFENIAAYCYIKPDVGINDVNVQGEAEYKALKFDANGEVDENGARGCQATDKIRYIVPFSYVTDGGASAWNTVAKHFLDDDDNPVAYVLRDTDSVGAQTYVGVASKCGSDHGDAKNAANNPIHDIYAWGTLSGTLAESNRMSISMDFNDGRDTSATGSYGVDVLGVITAVSFEITGDISAHDLLYVLGEKSAHADNTDASLSNSVEFTGEITLPLLSLPLSGNVVAGGSAKTTCTANIIVTSRESEYKCFADTDTPGECQVKLEVDCQTREVVAMYIRDTRTCDSSTNPVGCAGETPLTVPVDGITHTINVDTAIVDAVRMGNTRAYPHNDQALSDPGNADSLDEFEDFTDFTCITAACDTDAFILLDTNSGTHNGECMWKTDTGSPVSIAQTNGNTTWSGECTNSDSTPGSIVNTNIITPSETFVQFYVYGIATFDNIVLGTINNLITTGRRLGAPQESGEVTSKTIMLIAPRSVIQH